MALKDPMRLPTRSGEFASVENFTCGSVIVGPENCVFCHATKDILGGKIVWEIASIVIPIHNVKYIVEQKLDE